MSKRIIAALSAETKPGSVAVQGQEVELDSDTEASLEEQGALVPKDFDSFVAFDRAKQDAYRSGRGDTEAAQRAAEARKGGIVTLDGGIGDQTHGLAGQYAETLRTDSLTIDEALGLVGDDPEKAQAMLEAENIVTGGEPRKGLVEALEAINRED